MGKLLLLLLLGGAVWAGWQIHTKGVDGAFGGALAPSAAATDPKKHAMGAHPDRVSPHAQLAPEPGVD